MNASAKTEPARQAEEAPPDGWMDPIYIATTELGTTEDHSHDRAMMHECSRGLRGVLRRRARPCCKAILQGCAARRANMHVEATKHHQVLEPPREL